MVTVSVIGSSISSTEDSVVLSITLVAVGIKSFGVVFIIAVVSVAIEVGVVSCDVVIDGSPSSFVVK